MKKKYFFIVLFFCCNGIIYAQYTSIPDAHFEQQLIDLNIDSDHVINGHVLTSDVNTVLTLSVYNNITSMVGIQDFTALEYLEVSNNPDLYSIDISNNLNLKTFICQGNLGISTINVSNNVLLETLGIEGSYLSSLNLTNNINLKYLGCNYCNLNTLDVSNNPNLIVLQCVGNNLYSLNVHNNILLDKLIIDSNHISTINISQNILLKELVCRLNLIQSIDLSNNLLLELLICNGNPISTLNLSNNLNLDTLSCKNTNLSTLNLNNNILLGILYCGNNSNLNTLYVQNGANNLLNGTYSNGGFPPVFYNKFDATNNPNLHCIFVDDVANCNTNWLGKDATSNYVSTQAQCDAALTNEQFVNVNISIYPNPTTSLLNITGNNNIKFIQVYDLLGKTVLQENSSINQINVSQLQSGFYIIKITDETSNFTSKFYKL